MHPLHGVCHHVVHGFHESFVFGFFVIWIKGVLAVEVVVVIDEVDWSEGAVALHFSHHASDAVAVVGVVLGGECYAIVADGYQPSVGCYIEAYALMHYGFGVFRLDAG